MVEKETEEEYNFLCLSDFYAEGRWLIRNTQDFLRKYSARFPR